MQDQNGENQMGVLGDSNQEIPPIGELPSRTMADGESVLQTRAVTIDHYDQFGTLAAFYKESDFDAPPLKWIIAIKESVPMVVIVLFVLETICSGYSFALDYFSEISWLDTLKQYQWLVALLSFGIGINDILRRRSEEIEIVVTSQSVWQYVKYIWPGSGQIRFSGGSRGVMISNKGGYTYLIEWEKISHIYLENDPEFFEFSPSPDNYYYYYDSEEEYTERLTTSARRALPGQDEGRQLSNKRRIRIRLINTQPASRTKRFRDNYIEELIIPSQFFNADHEPLKMNTFLKRCWEMKAIRHMDQ